MSFAYDPEIGAALQAMLKAFGAPPPPPPRGDALALRASLDPLMEAMKGADCPGIERRSYEVKSFDGATIPIRWYSKPGSRPGSAVLHIHGGGMICGSLELDDNVTAGLVAATGVPMLAVDYRLAPEHPHPKPVEDCFAALAWLFDHASEFGVDPKRIAVMGESAGGGLAAAVALVARDRGRKLAKQILVYPMLDDRNLTPDPEMVNFINWTFENNYTGWRALIGGEPGKDGVPAHCAPARATDLRGLAPAYIEVGELDIFRNEDVDYARRLGQAAIPVELHVHQGAPHGFERLAPDSAVAKRAMADRYRVVRAL